MLPKYRSILILFLSIDERMGGKERGRKEGEEERKRKGMSQEKEEEEDE